MDDTTPKKSIDYTPTLGDGIPPPSPTSEMLWAERIRASIEEIASEEAANAAARRTSSPEIAFEGRTPFPAVANSEIEADDEVIVTFRKFFGDHKTMEFIANGDYARCRANARSKEKRELEALRAIYLGQEPPLSPGRIEGKFDADQIFWAGVQAAEHRKKQTLDGKPVPIQAPASAIASIQRNVSKVTSPPDDVIEKSMNMSKAEVSDILRSSRDPSENSVFLNTQNFGLPSSKRDSRDAPRRENKSTRDFPEPSSSSSSSDSDDDKSDRSGKFSSSSGSEDGDRRNSVLLPSGKTSERRSKKSKRDKKKKRHSKSSSSSNVRIYADQPSYAHIQLGFLSLNTVFSFWSEIAKYAEKYDIALPAATLVTDDIRRQIMAVNSISRDRTFYQLSHRDLARCIQKTIRPTSVPQFSQLLEHSLQWPTEQGRVLTTSNFQVFYNRLLAYRTEFKEKYAFLAHDNETNCPKLENKENCTIRIFLDVIPDGYGKKVFASLKKTKYDDLNEFLNAFCAKAKSHYDIAIKAKELSTFIPNRPFIPSSARPASATPVKKTFMRRPVLNNVAQEYVEEDMEGAAETWMVDDEDPLSFQPAEASDYEYEADPHMVPAPFDLAQLNAFGGGTFKSQQTPSRPPPKPMGAPHPTSSAFGKPLDKPKGPQGCFRALTEGKCTKPGCTFEHSVAVLDATRKDLEDKIRKRLYAARPLNAVSLTEQALDPPGSGKA